MTAEIAIELLDDPDRAVLAHGPLVEGALAAGVAAQGGAGLDAVLAAVQDAGRTDDSRATDQGQQDAEPAVGGGQDSAAERIVTLRNPLGLHARPAAAVAALAGSAAAGGTLLQVGRADGPLTDAGALLRIVGLGLRGGDQVRAVARGPDAERALDDLSDLLASGFGELEPVGRDPASAEPTPVHHVHDGTDLQGTAASPGTAVAPVLVLDEPTPDLTGQEALGPDEERRRAEPARDEVIQQLRAAAPDSPGADVLAMHAALLADPDLDAAVSARLHQGQPAEQAWWGGALEVAATLADS